MSRERKRNNLKTSEQGMVFVEATLLLPFCFIMIIALFYAALFMCQRAILQVNLQDALIYYRNIESDAYVEVLDKVNYTTESATVAAEGNKFGGAKYLSPYRFVFNHFKEDKFKTFCKSVCGIMFFSDADDLKITAKESNYLFYKKITATVTQTVRPAISLSMVGASDSMEISVTGYAVVADGDDMIRNVDFAVDIVSNTKIGQKASELVEKAKGCYDKFKEKFGIGDET